MGEKARECDRASEFSKASSPRRTWDSAGREPGAVCALLAWAGKGGKSSRSPKFRKACRAAPARREGAFYFAEEAFAEAKRKNGKQSKAKK